MSVQYSRLPSISTPSRSRSSSTSSTGSTSSDVNSTSKSKTLAKTIQFCDAVWLGPTYYDFNPMRKNGKEVGRIYQLGRWCLKKVVMGGWTGAVLGLFIVGIKIANGQEHAMRETGIAASVCAGVWFVLGVLAYIWKVNPMYCVYPLSALIFLPPLVLLLSQMSLGDVKKLVGDGSLRHVLWVLVLISWLIPIVSFIFWPVYTFLEEWYLDAWYEADRVMYGDPRCQWINETRGESRRTRPWTCGSCLVG
ncbi:hypothetical protein CC2G_009807 [Coprinopsis cinerea AmutBmut pab1-1]|nr:hypothetical protein CC2G_009807 [Coprinopsis cinerea AmutBmut pab1-1]